MKKINTDRSIRNTLIFGFVSLFVVLGAFAAWSALADLNGAVVAPATIVAETYSKKVQHREGGNIERILVKDGDEVKEGQDMIQLDPTETKAELTIIQSQLDEVLVRKLRLAAQRDGQTEITLPDNLKSRAAEPALADIIAGQQRLLASTFDTAQSKKNQLLEQIGQINDQIKGIDAQMVAAKSQGDLVATETESLRKLQLQGLVPESRINTNERESARLAGELGQLTASKASAQTKIGEIKLQTIQIDEEVRNQALTDLRDTDSKIAELEGRQVAALSRLGRMVIKAPITGTIYQMSVHTEGGVVAPGETLMMVLPANDDLVLQAQVTPNDINHVHEGQPAHIRFNGFSSRLVPEINATVTQVAADTTRTDNQTPPFYAIRLTISAKELEKLGDNKLKPGMSAEAFIQTEARSPFSYLVKPLTDMLAHAMRES
jgi:HlyD family secretion protein